MDHSNIIVVDFQRRARRTSWVGRKEPAGHHDAHVPVTSDGLQRMCAGRTRAGHNCQNINHRDCGPEIDYTVPWFCDWHRDQAGTVEPTPATKSSCAGLRR
ncbi:MAG TPA: hypothetical protein VLA17_13475 [Candidatus Limnocylindria bacterium]|nr:hypothetical protein [Candidatus Limnocylindria bacterium]